MNGTTSDTILLIKTFNAYSPYYVPLGLLAVGSYLEAHGFKVSIFDPVWYPNWQGELKRRLKDPYLWIGVNGLSSDVKPALALVEFCRQHSPSPLVWGGIHATLFPEQLIQSGASFVVEGEGKYPSLALSQLLQQGADDFSGVKGLWWKNTGRFFHLPQNEYVDLEKLPPINYDLIEIERYLNKNYPSLPYQSSRGCPGHCTFCINVVTRNRRFRYKSSQKLYDELARLKERYRLRKVDFIDDNFFAYKPRVFDFISLLEEKPLYLKWFAECRADYFNRVYINEQFLARMVATGLTNISIGAESGSDHTLQQLDKGITVSQIEHSLEVVAKFPELEASYGFIIGLPDETKEDLFATVDLLRKIVTRKRLVSAALVVFTPYPRCELTQDLVRRGLFVEPKSLEEWTSPRVINLYTNRFQAKPWNKHKRLVERLSRYSLYAYDVFNENELKKRWRHPSLVQLPLLMVIAISKWRMKHRILAFPIELYFVSFYRSWLSKLAKLRAFFRTYLNRLRQ